MKRLMLAVVLSAASLFLFGCYENQPAEPVGTETGEEDTKAVSSTLLRTADTDENLGVPAWVQTYEIVVENLTPQTGAGSSQPFSPPVLATHRRNMFLFHKGTYASGELAQVAEDAVNGPLVDKLTSSPRVFDVVQGGGVILPGAEDRYEIRTNRKTKRLSIVFMLVNTNDGFGGLDAVKLPGWGEKVYYARAYDAGSEQNTELASDIPGPCCGSPGEGTDERRRVRYHAGIQGDGDLDPAVYGWSVPVAKITIRRVNPTYEITLENLTPATVPGGSQVFSPPVLASHRPGVRMFRVGRFASDALAKIAEDGDKSAMAEMFSGSPKVFSVVEGAGPVLPGGSATYEIDSRFPLGWLSMVFMLVNTNDGFSGADLIRLPFGGSRAYYLDAYDAGSEENTELASDIPGPCCGNPGQGPDEHRRIRHHAGILGTGDLAVADYGWTDPVAKLTITRVK